MEKNNQDAKESMPEIKKDVALAPYTTMEVGGKAKLLVEAKTVVELVQAITYAVENEEAYLVLGGGSNVIISDDGFDGLVIINKTNEVLVNDAHSVLQVDSGVKSGKAASVAASAGLSGLEFYFGIPGTIGGAVYGNAGIRGHETKDVLKDLVILTVKEEEEGPKPVIIKRSRDWLQYEYRGSKLKNEHFSNKYPPVILTARFQLYPARREVIMQRTKEYTSKRSNQPYGLKTAGCIFRNPGTDPEMAAGRLLDQAGAKRLAVGGAAVAKQHANFLYNKGTAKANDLFALIEACHKMVENKFNLDLHREVELIGDFSEEKKEA